MASITSFKVFQLLAMKKHVPTYKHTVSDENSWNRKQSRCISNIEHTTRSTNAATTTMLNMFMGRSQDRVTWHAPFPKTLPQKLCQTNQFINHPFQETSAIVKYLSQESQQNPPVTLGSLPTSPDPKVVMANHQPWCSHYGGAWDLDKLQWFRRFWESKTPDQWQKSHNGCPNTADLSEIPSTAGWCIENIPSF